MSRDSYLHLYCTDSASRVTRVSPAIAALLTEDPNYYGGGTYCVWCKDHMPVREFVWIEDGYVTDIKVGT